MAVAIIYHVPVFCVGQNNGFYAIQGVYQK